MNRTMLMMSGLLAACGGYGSSTGNPSGPSGPLTAQTASQAGNNQVASVGADLPIPMRILVRRGGVPAAGVTVNWSATGAGAAMIPGVDVTDANGISTSIWNLGAEAGPHSAQAVVAGAESGSPVTFMATALAPGEVPPGVTVLLRSAGGNRFEPNALTIPLGTTVTWVWADGFHNVNHTLGRSGNPVNAPTSYAFTFTQPGSYTFFCEVHGSPTAGMRGSIEVR